MDEGPAPLVADDVRAEHDVAERTRLAGRERLEPVDREGEDVGRLVDPEVLALQRAHLVRRDERDPELAVLDSLAGEHLPGERHGARLVDDRGAPVRDLDLDHHRRRADPVSSACRLYASTIRCTSLCRTTSSCPNSTKPTPSSDAEDVPDLDQARRLLARQVDLRHVAGHDHPRAEAEPRQEHLHLLGRRVLRLVEDHERVVQRPPAHECERRDLDRPAVDVRVQAVGVHRVVERVEERPHVRVDLGEDVARQEAEPLPGLDCGPREDDPADLLLGERLHGERDREVRLARSRRADRERHRRCADRVDVRASASRSSARSSSRDAARRRRRTRR